MTSVKQSLFWSFMEQGGSKVIALVVQIVLARMLSPEAFGIIAILLVFTTIADSIAQSGLGMALIQRSETVDDDYSTAFWMSCVVAVAAYFALWAIAPIVSSFYGQEELEILLRALALVVIFNAANSVQRSWLQRKMNFNALFRANLTGVVASGLLGIISAYFGWGIWALVVQTLSQGFLTFLAFFIVVPWKPRLHFDARVARELFSYGWKICITGILTCSTRACPNW